MGRTVVETQVAVAAVSGFAAGILALSLVRSLRNKRKGKNACHGAAPAAVSSRGDALSGPPIPYFTTVMEAFMNPYHPQDNTDGVILMAVAENKLTFDDILRPAFVAAEPPKGAFNYNSMRGSADLRQQIARLMSEHVCPGVAVNPDNLAVNAGVAATLSNTLYALLEEGDAVLIPAPYYAAFDNDLQAVAKVQPIPVPCTAPNYTITAAQLADAYDAACAQGHRPAGLLLTNPSNPLGRCYSVAELETALEFCRLRSMHFISDEIYALSTFHGLSRHNKEAGVEEIPFTSVAKVMGGNLGDYVHVLWGFSKDFGASGLRVGCLLTSNQRLLGAMDNISVFSGTSGTTQAALAAVLSDEKLVEHYLEENSRRLAASYDLVADALARMRVPFVACASGMFIWADMRVLLTEPTWEGEDQWFLAMKERGVVLTPGQSQHTAAPGYFRICYAFQSVEVLREALHRLEEQVAGRS